MGQTPPKYFQQPMPYGSSQGSNIVSPSQPAAQVQQPQQPFTNLQQVSQTAQAPQEAPQQPQRSPFYPMSQAYRGGMNWRELQ